MAAASSTLSTSASSPHGTQRHRSGASSSSSSSASGPRVVLRDLPDPLQICVASFLPALAAVRMGAAAKWCRALYPSQARGTLELRQWPLEEGPPESLDEYERTEWVTSHAMTLARLLRRLPELDSLKLVMRDRARATSCWVSLDHVLGQALLLLPPRARLSEIYFCGESCHRVSRSGENFLVLAIVAGKTPGLQSLRRGEQRYKRGNIVCLASNFALLASSIKVGHLPSLTSLQISADDLHLVLDAYEHRHECGEPQAMVKELEVIDYADTDKEVDPSFLKELLLLPCFGRLSCADRL